MTAAIAEAGVARRTHQPVRKYSRPFADGEAYFRPLTEAQARLIMQSARVWSQAHMVKRAKGKRWGPLTPIDVHILDVLVFKAMNWKSGKLDWSYNQIADKVQRSKQTVAESLARLRDHGWLAWIRRFEPAEDAGRGRGPQVKQATNAYRVMLPRKVSAWFEKQRRKKAGPPPVDHEAARAQRAAQIREMELGEQAAASPAIQRAEAKIAAEKEAARRRSERES